MSRLWRDIMLFAAMQQNINRNFLYNFKQYFINGFHFLSENVYLICNASKSPNIGRIGMCVIILRYI